MYMTIGHSFAFTLRKVYNNSLQEISAAKTGVFDGLLIFHCHFLLGQIFNGISFNTFSDAQLLVFSLQVVKLGSGSI